MFFRKIDAFISLVLIAIVYKMLMPFMNLIANLMMSYGAPAAGILFLLKMLQWGFLIFAAAAILIMFGWIFYRTEDTQRQ